MRQGAHLMTLMKYPKAIMAAVFTETDGIPPVYPSRYRSQRRRHAQLSSKVLSSHSETKNDGDAQLEEIRSGVSTPGKNVAIQRSMSRYRKRARGVSTADAPALPVNDVAGMVPHNDILHSAEAVTEKTTSTDDMRISTTTRNEGHENRQESQLLITADIHRACSTNANDAGIKKQSESSIEEAIGSFAQVSLDKLSRSRSRYRNRAIITKPATVDKQAFQNTFGTLESPNNNAAEEILTKTKNLEEDMKQQQKEEIPQKEMNAGAAAKMETVLEETITMGEEDCGKDENREEYTGNADNVSASELEEGSPQKQGSISCHVQPTILNEEKNFAYLERRGSDWNDKYRAHGSRAEGANSTNTGAHSSIPWWASDISNTLHTRQLNDPSAEDDVFLPNGLLGRSYSTRQTALKYRDNINASQGPFPSGPTGGQVSVGRSVRHSRAEILNIGRSQSTTHRSKPLLESMASDKEPFWCRREGCRLALDKTRPGGLVESATSRSNEFDRIRPNSQQQDEGPFLTTGLLSTSRTGWGGKTSGRGVMDGSKVQISKEVGPILDVKGTSTFAAGSLLHKVEASEGPWRPVIDRGKGEEVVVGTGEGA